MDIIKEDENPIEYFILNNRPNGIPAKTKNEEEKHRQEYQKLLKSIQKKQLDAERKRNSYEQQRKAREKRQADLIKKWKEEILPDWSSVRHSKEVRDVWYQGLPAAVRGQVWTLVVGNRLNITRGMFKKCCDYVTRFPGYEMIDNDLDLPSAHSSPKPSESPEREEAKSPNSAIQPNFNRRISTFSYDSSVGLSADSSKPLPKRHVSMDDKLSITDDSDFFEHSNGSEINLDASFESNKVDDSIEKSLKVINLDVNRTFPTLKLFQKHSGAYHDKLKQLLAAYVAFQPDIGYVQGMSFIAATLLLVIGDQFEAFVALVNILNRPCHSSLFSLDEKEFMVYFYMYNSLLEMKLPKVAKRLKDENVEPYIYLYDWLVTMFSRSLILDTRVFVWDLFFLDGELALFQGALAILNIYKDRIVNSEFDDIAAFLTAPMPTDLTVEVLLASIKSVNLTKAEYESVESQVRERLYPQPEFTILEFKEPLLSPSDGDDCTSQKKKIQMETLSKSLDVKVPSSNVLDRKIALFTSDRNAKTISNKTQEWNSLVKEPEKYPSHLDLTRDLSKLIPTNL